MPAWPPGAPCGVPSAPLNEIFHRPRRESLMPACSNHRACRPLVGVAEGAAEPDSRASLRRAKLRSFRDLGRELFYARRETPLIAGRRAFRMTRGFL